MNHPTSEDDTHPSAADRFRLVRGIRRKDNTVYEDALVWDLFVNRDALTYEMNNLINESISR
jgi:hypothetical protein